MVRKTIFFLLLLVCIMTACSQKVTESYLVGGSWYEKVEYKDGEPVDEPSCVDFFTKGLEFKEDRIVYNEDHQVNYEFELLELGGEPGITFIRERGNRHAYHIEIITDDEIKLSGGLLW